VRCSRNEALSLDHYVRIGVWPGSSHIDVEALLSNPERARTYRAMLAAAGLSISSLPCHENPIHPNEGIASRDALTFRQTVRLAELLQVPVVVKFSGCLEQRIEAFWSGIRLLSSSVKKIEMPMQTQTGRGHAHDQSAFPAQVCSD
jgi:hypothetical protein